MPLHKNSAVAQSTKKLHCGTKQNAVAHKTVLRHKNSTTECHGGKCNAAAKNTKTQDLHATKASKAKAKQVDYPPPKKQPLQKNTTTNKAKMAATMPLWWPMPHRLIVPPNPCGSMVTHHAMAQQTMPWYDAPCHGMMCNAMECSSMLFLAAEQRMMVLNAVAHHFLP